MPLLQAVPQSHTKLVDTMFLVGAAMAAMPFLIGGGLAVFLLWRKRGGQESASSVPRQGKGQG